MPDPMDEHPPLCLDPRQIAMLHAMGVRVWSQAAAAAPGHVQAPAQPQPARIAVAADGGSVPAPLQGASHRASAMSWPELQEAVAGCQACGLCTHRKNTVFGVGPQGRAPEMPPKVDWLLVGEAPGEQEDLAGEPFVGQAGKLLDNMLACLGLSRNASSGAGLYIANTLKCRPPANRNPSPEESAACAPWLARQIELLQPRLIVAMGRFAAQSLLAGSVADIEKVPLGRLRGQVHRHRGIPVVVTYHPAYLLRNLPDKAKAWEDWVLAAQHLQTSPPANDTAHSSGRTPCP